MNKFSFCFNDVDGCTMEYSTLTERKKAAIQYSKKYPDLDISIYVLSNLHIKCGKECE